MPQHDFGFGRFLQLLFARHFPAWLRYGATLAAVLFFTAVRISAPLPEIGFVLFIPAVFIAAVAFGRGPGLLATALTTLAAAALLLETRPVALIPPSELVSVAVYVAIGVGVTLICHTLRTMTLRTMAAERAMAVQLEELAHRTKNDLQTVASLLKLQARGLDTGVVRAALDAAAMRVLAIAKLHRRLRTDGRAGVVDMHDYLHDLCGDLRETHAELRPVAVRIEADHAVLGTDVAAPLGLIVNELVTNAFKYAFAGEAGGTITVSFRHAAGGGYVLTVADDGVGSRGSREGLGSRLVRLLVQQLDGTLTRRDPDTGTSVAVTIPAR